MAVNRRNWFGGSYRSLFLAGQGVGFLGKGLKEGYLLDTYNGGECGRDMDRAAIKLALRWVNRA
jgi:hypothetical protein